MIYCYIDYIDDILQYFLKMFCLVNRISSRLSDLPGIERVSDPLVKAESVLSVCSRSGQLRLGN